MPGVSRLRIHTALPLALLFALPGLAAAGVRWRSGVEPRPPAMQRAELEDELERHAAGARHVVVYFDAPVEPARRAALEAGGVRLLDYLGDHAWFGAVGPAVDAPAAARVSGLRAVRAIDPLRKLHPDLAAGIVRPWSVLPLPGPDGTTEVAVYVLLHRDVEARSAAAPLLAAHGGRVRSYLHAVNGVVAHLAAARVADLAAEDAVMYVEPPLPSLREVNSSNRALVGADVLQDPPWELSGAGVNVMVYDGGRVAAHTDLAGRLTIGTGESSGISDHSTHVACTVAGDGAASGGAFRGMAPGATITSYAFEQEGGLSQGFLYTDPGDIETDYTNAITIHGVDLANNSIGTNTSANGFPCEWEGNYGVTGALIDEIARGALGTPFPIVWANGNERSTGNCGIGYHTTAPPACAKNHITVGALYSDLDIVTSFSSWGPCDDGRLKPDVSAPGCQASDDFGVTSCSALGGYGVKCGTSMAAPTASGVAALLLEQYRASYPGQSDFRGSTLKVILAQTATDLGNVGPDYQTGYGSIRAAAAAELIVAGNFDESEVAQGAVAAYAVVVDPGQPQLKVTLAWDDPAGTPDVDPVLVNDLDLRVIDPDGVVHYPWTLDPDNPFLPAVRIERDAVNNIEQVVIDDPLPGYHRVEVSGFDVAAGGSQPFSVAAGPNLNGCSSAGALNVDAMHLVCEATLALEVVDCDPNVDDTTVETVSVHLTSSAEPAGEDVVLSEAAPFLARFTGTIPLSTTDAPGVLQVADGQTVEVTYIDADDGAGSTNVPVTRQVFIDCTVPVVESVTANAITRHEATIEVAVSEPTYLELTYGTDCAARNSLVSGAVFSADHHVQLTGLADGVTYYYAVEVRDEAGNVVLDDSAGSCHQFSTEVVPEFFTQQFPTAFDLEGKMITFTPTGPPDLYAACTEPLTNGLPTDPEGGADLDLADDVARSFTLDGPERVRLYGVEYATLWVGPNGFVTFGEGDNTYEESTQAHFSLPRVSAFFDDLQPGAGGAVLWQQLDDRLAITWVDVPEYQKGGKNTFQIEMFFDGRIRLAWLAMDATGGLVGLSAGSGLDPDFSQTDLSAAAGCGPFPPLTRRVFDGTSIGEAVNVQLLATDDGLPLPQQLIFRIASLPQFGTLSDPASGASLDAVPAELAGDVVTYLPYPGYGGSDQFDFTADDGGTAPEGGQSQSATASIGVAIGPPVTLHEFLADDADPGWSTTGEWEFGAPSGGGSHGGDPVAGATGANVYGYNLGGDYSDGMAKEYLTSPALGLANVSGVQLEFRRWLGIEGSTHDHAAVQVSTDGTTWSNVWTHLGPPIDETAWSLQSYDVSAVADGEPAVSFRWVMGTTDAAGTYPGWNIDDVRVVGTRLPTCNRAPGQAQNLSFAADRRTLSWSYTPTFGEGVPVFDTLRSTSAAAYASAAVCIEADGGDAESDDGEAPAQGVTFFYLVRVEGACGPGPLGAGRTAPACLP